MTTRDGAVAPAAPHDAVGLFLSTAAQASPAALAAFANETRRW